MSFITMCLIAIGLAMDAFAVSVSNGIALSNFKFRDSVRQGVYFGGFQFIMPLMGWTLGNSIRQYIEAVDHWIAFILLGVIGVNMIKECFTDEDCDCGMDYISTKTMVLQAVATSIDALAVGISLAILNINIVYACSIIGIVAFIFSFSGGFIGKYIGGFLNKKAEIIGGIILIFIGLKILLEHTVF